MVIFLVMAVVVVVIIIVFVCFVVFGLPQELSQPPKQSLRIENQSHSLLYLVNNTIVSDLPAPHELWLQGWEQ